MRERERVREVGERENYASMIIDYTNNFSPRILFLDLDSPYIYDSFMVDNHQFPVISRKRVLHHFMLTSYEMYISQLMKRYVYQCMCVCV